MKKKIEELRIGAPGSVGRRLNFMASTLTEAKKRRIAETFAKYVGPRLLPAEFKQKYDVAYYEKLRHTEKKRKALEFLRQWYHRGAVRREVRQPTVGWDRTFFELLAPLLDALEKRDTEFLEALTQAVRILEQRETSNRIKYPGSLDKWLLEYGLFNGWSEIHTPHELNEQFVSKFRTITDKKLHEKLHELGVPHKDEPSGRASPAYGQKAKKAGREARAAWDSW
jgi:hypothetical protein